MDFKQDRQPESIRKVDVSHDFRRLFHENGDEILVHWDLHLQVKKTFRLVVVRQEMEETSGRWEIQTFPVVANVQTRQCNSVNL